MIQGMENLGERISRLRKEKGLTQVELAKRLHISPATMCRWEKNERKPSKEDVAAIADIFGVAETELTGEEENQRVVNPVTPITKKRPAIFLIIALLVIILGAVAAFFVWNANHNSYTLLEERRAIGSFGEVSCERNYLVSGYFKDEQLAQFSERTATELKSDPKYADYKSFSFSFFQEGEDDSESDQIACYVYLRNE